MAFPRASQQRMLLAHSQPRRVCRYHLELVEASQKRDNAVEAVDVGVTNEINLVRK